MRHCNSCGAPIDAHTLAAIPLATIALIQRTARNPADARRRTREASRVCPLEVNRIEGGMPIYRAVRSEPVQYLNVLAKAA